MNVKLIRIVIPLVLIAGVTYLTYKIRTAPATAGRDVKSLPRDVDEVLKKFSYSENGEDVCLKLSGTMAVRRGKKILGFRSTVVKETRIENLAGEWSGKKRRVLFTAKQATWDMLKDHPLLLSEDVAVTVNGVPVRDVNIAKLYLKRRAMEIHTDRIRLLHIQ